MFRLRDISIRNKLILIQVFTSILVLSVFFAVFVIADLRGYKQRKVKSTLSLAHVIGVNSISTLQFEDNETANEMLSELHAIAPEVVYALITDKKGKRFASYTLPRAESVTIPPGLATTGSEFTGNALFVSDNLVDNSEIVGRIVLAVDLDELRQMQQYKYEIAAILVIVALVFSFLIALAIQTYVSKRLLQLVKTMKRVGDTGNYDQAIIPDEGKDEISILVRVFDDLMRQVKENERRKDEFIGIASHELKTPLTSVRGYIELLREMEDNPNHAQCIQKALENVNKLEKLIKDLLDVSKIQSGQLELTMTEFSLDSLVDETISSFQMISKTHRIERQEALNGEIVHADRQRIEQVLINLLSNAIKYSPGEDRVIVHTERKNGELIISVRDFGIGIPEGERVNIFERFYRTQHSSVHISGFGLGLYISRDIALRHGGRIWVEAEERGSVFHFSLPLKPTMENGQSSKRS